jgi:hypothetical protein
MGPPHTDSDISVTFPEAEIGNIGRIHDESNIKLPTANLREMLGRCAF